MERDAYSSLIPVRRLHLLFAHFYGHEQAGEALQPAGGEIWPRRRYACGENAGTLCAALAEHSRMSGGFLEIGADIGIFAQACAKAGIVSHAWLYEPNRDVHGELANPLSGPTALHPRRDVATDDVPGGQAYPLRRYPCA